MISLVGLECRWRTVLMGVDWQSSLVRRDGAGRWQCEPLNLAKGPFRVAFSKLDGGRQLLNSCCPEWRESTRYYDRLPARRPDLKLLIAAGREDHVQTAPGKPHIRQAFDGFARNGMWVKLNPSPAQVAAVSPEAASLDLPDLPANRPPADWYEYSYAYPEGVADNIFQAAATREMAELINNPAGSVAAVVNAASYDNGVAPGALVSIFGSNLVSEIASASTVPLPHALRGAYVLVNGLPAPLLYVSPNQINLQIPWEVTPGEAAFEVNGVEAAVTVIPATRAVLPARTPPNR